MLNEIDYRMIYVKHTTNSFLNKNKGDLSVLTCSGSYTK